MSTSVPYLAIFLVALYVQLELDFNFASWRLGAQRREVAKWSVINDHFSLGIISVEIPSLLGERHPLKGSQCFEILVFRTRTQPKAVLVLVLDRHVVSSTSTSTISLSTSTIFCRLWWCSPRGLRFVFSF